MSTRSFKKQFEIMVVWSFALAFAQSDNNVCCKQGLYLDLADVQAALSHLWAKS